MDSTRRSFAAALAAAPWLAAARDRAVSLPAVGSPLALTDLPLLDGGTFRAAQAQGKVLAVYWWASWCPFCAEMSPGIEKLWTQHRARGLEVLGISVDKDAEAPRAYRQRRGYTFPSAWYAPGLEKALPNPGTIPVLVVRGRDGRVVMAEKGQLFPEDVEQVARFL